MTEETVARLDYSKPPPGYSIGPDTGENAGGWFWIRGPQDGEGHRGDVGQTEAEVHAAAWAHFKSHNDPPGMTEIFGCGGLVDGEVVRGFKFRIGIASDETLYANRESARAAAWAWHDHRLAISERLATLNATAIQLGHMFVHANDLPWPRPLLLSDADAEAVTTYLDSKGTLFCPEVLRCSP